MNFFISGVMTALNEYINVERTPRRGATMAAKIKRYETQRVQYSAHDVAPVKKYPVRIKMTWFCPDGRHDPDNIAFAKKFILDGLVHAGILVNDGWKQVRGFSDEFEIDADNPGVQVEIIEET